MTFVDTNVLLYAISPSPVERKKAEVARAILRRDDLVVSVQVLQEFYVQATRATRSDPLSHREAAALVDLWLRFRVVAVDVPLMCAALHIRERYQTSYWDAAILAAANNAGCSELLSEDLNPGQHFGAVQVCNPFA
jgi:predicted nucleic acid-binding protein